jgi:hypothetical protein
LIHLCQGSLYIGPCQGNLYRAAAEPAEAAQRSGGPGKRSGRARQQGGDGALTRRPIGAAQREDPVEMVDLVLDERGGEDVKIGDRQVRPASDAAGR